MKRTAILYCGTVAILGATLLAGRMLERSSTDQLAAPLETFPERLGGWASAAQFRLTGREEEMLQPTAVVNRVYRKQDLEAQLFIAYYAQQRAGETMHSPRGCLPGSGWEIGKQESATVPFRGIQAPVNQFSIQNAGQRMLAIYWYQSRKRVIANEYLGKALLVRDALVDGHSSGSLVRIILPDRSDAVKEGLELAALVMPEVQRCIGY